MFDGADGLGVGIVHDVDFGPVVSSLCISARFVLFHPLPAFLLSVALDFAKIAVFAVSIIVASASGVAGTSARSCLVSSSSRVVVSSALYAGLITSGLGPSSVEGCDVVGFAFGGLFFLPDLVY